MVSIIKGASAAQLDELLASMSLDPLETFFRAMPSPEEHHTADDASVFLAVHNVEAAFLKRVEYGTTDPVCIALRNSIQRAREGGNLSILYKHLATLAFKKDIDPTDTNPMAVQLRYYKWIANGRKDETWPFSSVAPTAPIPAHSDYVCTVCGEENASMKCTGCLISSGKNVQKLSRGVGIFSDIFGTIPRLTFPREWKIQSVAREDTMLVIRNDAKQFHKVTDWSRFPSNIASDHDASQAVLRYNQCDAPLENARSLFEMFIRPACKSVVQVKLRPKNIGQAIRIINSDYNDFCAFSLHKVAHVTLPCGLQFAVDPTCAQHGWQYMIVPWATYSARHIHRVMGFDSVLPRPAGADIVRSAMGGQARIGQQLHGLMVEPVVHGLAKQMDTIKSDANMKKVLGLKEQDFVVARTSIVEAGIRGLNHLVELIEKGAQPTMDGELQALRGLDADDEEVLRHACVTVSLHFFTAADKARGRGDMSKINRIARPRWQKILELGPVPGVDVRWP
ncbi:hypothetical protein GE09DRAFT_1295637 [Coniochaeta sp. 2T2.1]|nr:hypothetical protein GE09DRAFT_1295637 [Coniochaeta sp. 2T2.1]